VVVKGIDRLGPQRFVTRDDLGKAALEDGDVEREREAERRVLVVEGIARHHLIE
jgi:hypothetical protein